MEQHIRIKHGIHEIEIKGSTDFIQGQIDAFYISINNYQYMLEKCVDDKNSKGGEMDEKTEKAQGNQ